MAQEIAAAYVTLLPSLKGAGKGIEKELGGAVEGASKKSDSSLRSMFGRAAGLAVAAGGVIAGVFGASKIFGGGMSRLMGIEEAQAKLRGLGHDAGTVETIMDNALASVKGTSFGMAEAATTAAGAVAAGIKPGADLERMLTTVSNSAAAAGVGMDEMGSIFNKVATVDMAQMDVLNQVSDRGIPVMQALADTLGVTTDEVRKMASAGEISFADFEAAMVQATGTVAEEMGGTLSGSIANFNASLGRIGANFLEGVFPYLAPAIQSLTGWLGGVEEAAAGAGEWLGEMWGRAAEALGSLQRGLDGERLVKDFGSSFHAIGGFIATYIVEPFGVAKEAVESFFRGFQGVTLVKDMGSPIHDFARNIGDAFRDAGGGFDGLVAVIQTTISSAADWLASGGAATLINGLLSGRAALVEAAIAVFMGIAEALPKILPEVVGVITGQVIPGLLAAIEMLLPQLVATITEMLPSVVAAAVGLIEGLAGALTTALPLIVDTLMTLLPMLLEAILGMLPTLIEAAITLFLGLVEGLTVALPVIITALVEAIPLIINALTSALPMLIEGAIQLFLGLVDGLLMALPEILVAVVEAVPQIVAALVGALPLLVDGAIQLFLGLIEGLVRATPEILVAVVALIPEIAMAILNSLGSIISAGAEIIWSLIKGIGQIVPQLLSGIGRIGSDVVSKLGEPVGRILARGREWINNLWDGIKNVWSSVSSWFGNLGSTINGLLSSAGSWLTDRGRQALDGMRTGIENGWRTLSNWFGNLPSRIRNTISGVGNWLKSSGRSLLSGFTSGIRDGFSNAMDAVRNGLTRIRNFFPFSPAKVGPFAGTGYLTYSGKAMMRDYAKAILGEESTLRGAAEQVMGSLRGSLVADVGLPHLAGVGASGPGIELHVTNNYPIAEPASTTNKRALDTLASMGVI